MSERMYRYVSVRYNRPFLTRNKKLKKLVDVMFVLTTIIAVGMASPFSFFLLKPTFITKKEKTLQKLAILIKTVIPETVFRM